METDLKPSDVPESEIFELSDFKDFDIKLENGGEMAKIIEFPRRKENKNNGINEKCL